MNTVGRGNLVDSAMTFDGFERDFGFEFRVILFTYLRHCGHSPSWISHERLPPYSPVQFSGSTIIIKIKSSVRPREGLEVTVTFNKSKINSQIEVSYTGESAREIVIGISQEILSRIEPYKTINWIFSSLLLVVLAGMGGQIVVVSLTSIATIMHIRYPLFQTMLAAVLIINAGYIALVFTMPYNIFFTRRNEKNEGKMITRPYFPDDTEIYSAPQCLDRKSPAIRWPPLLSLFFDNLIPCRLTQASDTRVLDATARGCKNRNIASGCAELQRLFGTLSSTPLHT